MSNLFQAIGCGVLLAAAAPSFAQESPIEINCAVHGAGGTITMQLNQDMRQELNEKMRETLELYNLQCLQNMVNLGGLGQLGISWPDLYEEACKAILDQFSQNGAMPDSSVLFTQKNLMAALDAMAAKPGVSK